MPSRAFRAADPSAAGASGSAGGRFHGKAERGGRLGAGVSVREGTSNGSLGASSACGARSRPRPPRCRGSLAGAAVLACCCCPRQSSASAPPRSPARAWPRPRSPPRSLRAWRPPPPLLRDETASPDPPLRSEPSLDERERESLLRTSPASPPELRARPRWLIGRPAEAAAVGRPVSPRPRSEAPTPRPSLIAEATNSRGRARRVGSPLPENGRVCGAAPRQVPATLS